MKRKDITNMIAVLQLEKHNLFGTLIYEFKLHSQYKDYQVRVGDVFKDKNYTIIINEILEQDICFDNMPYYRIKGK